LDGWFFEDVRVLFFGVNVVSINNSILLDLLHKPKSYIDVLHFSVQLRVVSTGDGVLIVAVEWNRLWSSSLDLFEKYRIQVAFLAALLSATNSNSDVEREL
jgi:hypothetical protein